MVDINFVKLYESDIEYFVWYKYLLILILSLIPVRLLMILRLVYERISRKGSAKDKLEKNVVSLFYLSN